MARGREVKRSDRILTLALVIAAAVCSAAPTPAGIRPVSGGLEPAPARLVRAARAYSSQPIAYDSGYRRLAYPNGDPGGRIGVCTDLVIRSYRAIGADLQKLVHEDMRKNYRAYPAQRLYNQPRPDPNIDHRRVPNLKTWFERHGRTLTNSIAPDALAEWKPGDVVVFDLLDNNIPSHIGIISDRKSASGLPLVFHHFPPLPSEEDCLANWKVIGHYRWFPREG